MDWTHALEFGGVAVVAVLYAIHHSRQRRRRQRNRERFGIEQAPDALVEPIEPRGRLESLLGTVDMAGWILRILGLIAFAACVIALFREGGVGAAILLATGIAMVILAVIWRATGRPVLPPGWRTADTTPDPPLAARAQPFDSEDRGQQS